MLYICCQWLYCNIYCIVASFKITKYIGVFFGATVYKRCLSCMQLLAFLVVQGVLYLENTSCNCPPPPRLGGSLGSSQSNDPANDSLRKKIEYLIKKTRQLHSDGSVFNMSLLQSDINSKNTYTLTLIFIIINNVYISLSCNPKNIYKEVLRTSTVPAAC